MEDGDTEKYHPSRVIQDCVFLSEKRVVSGVFLCRYIIKTKISLQNHLGIQVDIFFYQLPLILAALLHHDLINIVYLTALSGQCDIALALNQREY